MSAMLKGLDTFLLAWKKKKTLKNKFFYSHSTRVTLHKKHQCFKCHGGHIWLLKYFGTFLWLTWNISDKAAG